MDSMLPRTTSTIIAHIASRTAPTEPDSPVKASHQHRRHPYIGVPPLEPRDTVVMMLVLGLVLLVVL